MSLQKARSTRLCYRTSAAGNGSGERCFGKRPLSRLDPLPLGPEFPAAVAASERHRNSGFMARRTELASGADGIGSERGAGVYGQQRWNYYLRNYPDNVRRHYPSLAP